MSNELCKKCGKPPLAMRAGSVTSFFFQHNFCQCHLQMQEVDATPTCGNCGKSLPTDRRVGSFTAFLFKELRCQCERSAIIVKAAANSKVNGSNSNQKQLKRTTTKYRAEQKTQFTKNIGKNDSSSKYSKLAGELAPGTIVGGVFKIQSTIGLGGMGVVYTAEHTALYRQFALKVLRPELVNEQIWLRFKAEAKTLAALNHSTFVKVYDLGIHEQTLPFYSMDLVQGQNLEQILAQHGPCSLNRALEIFVTVLDGLAYAHRNGIIHRDLKPANIMLMQGAGNKAPEVKILDFGISKLVGGHTQELQNLTSAGEIFGSPYYMSPEQCTGRAVDARSDIYSIGCSLFEVLTGYVPFEAANSIEITTMHEEDAPPLLSDVMPDNDYPPSVDIVIGKCLAKLPENRYQSAKELAIDLTRILEGKDIAQYIPTKIGPRNTDDADLESDSEPNENSKKQTIIYATVALSVVALLIATFAVYSFASIKKAPAPATKVNGARLPSELDGEFRAKLAYQTLGHTKLREESGHSGGLMTEPISASDTTPFSSITKKNGMKYRCFNFPTDIQLGVISYTYNSPDIRVTAQGKVEIPLDAKSIFVASAGILENPIYWKRFRVGDFTGLCLLDTSLDDHEFDRELAESASNFANVNSLSLGSANLLDRSVSSLNKFKNLTAFWGCSSPQNLKLLPKATCWNNITQFTWHGQKASSPSAILKMLEKCQKLKELSIDNATLSPQDYEIIAHMPNLTLLGIDEMQMSLAGLDTLSKSSTIDSLRLPQGLITKNSIAILAKFKALKTLRGTVLGSHVKLKALLQKDLPNVKCYIYQPEPVVNDFIQAGQIPVK